MWWKLSGVGLLTAALIYAVFFMPITTTAVKLDMPSGTSAATAQHINAIALIAGWTVVALFVVAVFAISIWLAWRILRGRRSSERPAD
ncbi:MAG: hypothetical protein ACREC0_02640 [Methylocella sp.]